MPLSHMAQAPTLLLLAALTGCSAAAPGVQRSNASSPASAPTVPVTPGSPEATLPRCTSRGDVERLHGRRVLVEGRYEVEPVAGSKGLQAASIVLSDRTRLVRAYRPVPRELGLVNRRVRVVGTVYRDAGEPAHVQQVVAPHIRPERITLMPGEASPSPLPTALPAPPVVASAAELDRLDDRWVQVWGRLEKVTPHLEDSLWANALVRLQDGTPVHLRAVSRSRWSRLLGEEVTVVARVALTRIVGVGAKAPHRRLVDRAALCHGLQRRCDLLHARER